MRISPVIYVMTGWPGADSSRADHRARNVLVSLGRKCDAQMKEKISCAPREKYRAP
jgi:hypothetical protein